MRPAFRLRQLARLYGVQTAYYNVSRQRHPASQEALLAMLKSLGAPLTTLQDAPAAWRERRQALWQRLLEPVAVSWNGAPPALRLRLPVTHDAPISCQLSLEDGRRQRFFRRSTELPALESADVEGTTYAVRQLPLPGSLPQGYHRLTLETASIRAQALIISAPLRSYTPPGRNQRGWGVFLPLYALRTRRSRGSGDLAGMESLLSWSAGVGGSVAATLPLLAAFFDEASDPSPYTPVSRLFWNEFYLNLDSIPELAECPAAQALLASAPFQQETARLNDAPLMDYHRQMRLKRRVLAELCRCLFSRESGRLAELHRFAAASPLADDYARFRAATEKQGAPWRSWQPRLRGGSLQAGDYDEADRRYHLYVQWLAAQQMQHLAAKAREKGSRLYLDLPIGVHPDGYDAWRERSAFIADASAGAPPDAVFTRGQRWDFPPLHPEAIREQGYRYVIAYLKHHLRHAGMLRLDHVMGLHRLFCIPEGMPASQGVYIRYRAEEFYAILALESQRHRSIIVGEDLGTVPAGVRPAMSRHGLQRMYVLHYELESRRGLRPPPGNAIASLNTHDMPPFAAFWQGADIASRQEMGLLDSPGARHERKTRQALKETLASSLRERGWLKGAATDTGAMLKACLAFLSRSRARLVLVNLEDLWLETQPQNVPTTHPEQYPSWRRQARHSLEELCQMPGVTDTLQMVNRLRKQGGR